MKKNCLLLRSLCVCLASSLVAAPLAHAQWNLGQPMPNQILPGALQPGQWSDWQPVPSQGIPGQIQSSEWGPWQPVPNNSLIPGQFPPGQFPPGQWQPVYPNLGAPGTQGPPAGPRTVYKTQDKTVSIYNPLTGQYETRIIQEVVPVQIGADLSGGGSGGPMPNPLNPVGNVFTVTVVNRLDAAITFNIGNQNQSIGAGQSWQFSAAEGQEYNYSGSPREVRPGQWVGGAVYRGLISSNQRTITVGDQPGPAPNPNPNPSALMTVTFVNQYSGAVGIEVFDQNRNSVTSLRIPPGQRVAINVMDGYTYTQSGPVVYVNGGAISGTRQGQISASNPEIQLRD